MLQVLNKDLQRVVAKDRKMALARQQLIRNATGWCHIVEHGVAVIPC
jgi:hypothetical protein